MEYYSNGSNTFVSNYSSPVWLHNLTEDTWLHSNEESAWLHHVLYSIRTCFLPIVLLGTITNAFNFSILLRRDMRFLSTSVYLFALAIADTGVMYFELFRIWFEWANLVPPESYFTSAYCKVGNYANGVSRDFSNWLIACLTLERLMMVTFPHRAKNVCTVSTARTVTVCLLLVLCVPHIHCLVYSIPVRDDIGWTCCEDQTNTFGVLLSTIMDFTFGYLVIIVVFVLNILLITMICRSNLSYMISGVRSRACKNRRLTRTLFVVAMVFLVCETPRMIMAIIYRYQGRTPTKRILLNISYVISGLNHASNFFIYILASPRFRLLAMQTFPFKMCAAHDRNASRRRIDRKQYAMPKLN